MRHLKLGLALVLVLFVVIIGVNCGGLTSSGGVDPYTPGRGGPNLGGDATHGDALRRQLLHRYR